MLQSMALVYCTGHGLGLHSLHGQPVFGAGLFLLYWSHQGQSDHHNNVLFDLEGCNLKKKSSTSFSNNGILRERKLANVGHLCRRIKNDVGLKHTHRET